MADAAALKPGRRPSPVAHLTTADVVPIRSRRADIPEGLADVLHRALRREPGERYPDVLAFRKELKAWA